MPKPKNKEELIQAANEEYQRLNNLIDSFGPNERHAPFSLQSLNKNIRDVVAHIFHWQLLFFTWYEKGMKGQKPSMPAEGYTWRTVPDLNKTIWAQYNEVELSTIRNNLESSHEQIMALIRTHSDEELFQKKKYKWTGSTSLGAYLISATSSHYFWGRTLIYKGMK